MKKIDETFLHFLWKNQQLTGIITEPAGQDDIIVQDPGIHNQDAGPDFFNARIRINGTTWAGNVELHINASDWLRHGHSEDPAYDTVILHVVYFNDCEITRPDGSIIPVVLLRFPTLMWERYADLLKNGNWIPCQDHLGDIAPVHVAQWTSSLMTEKLEERHKMLRKNLEDVDGHYDAALSRILFRSFGIPVNTTPFEMLSILIPYPFLLRNRNDLFVLEALLFGQSGMLSVAMPHDKYVEGLRQEYQRFSSRLEGTAMPGHAWKFLRMRPSAFPSVRIAQLAALIRKTYPMHQYLESLPPAGELFDILRIRAGDYWNNHYQLGKETAPKPKIMGDQFMQLIIVNAIVPYLFFFGKNNAKQQFCDYSISLLEELPAENNVIIKKWGKFGLRPANAFESQAYLHLYKQYCKNRKCLQCQFGNNMILDDKNQK